MRFYYMLQPMTAVIATVSAFFLAGLIIGAIIGRVAGRRRMWRTLASKHNNALAVATEANKHYLRDIRRMAGTLHAEKCRNAEIAALVSKITMEVLE